MGIALAVLGIIIIAVTVGVVVSKKGSKNLSSSSSSGASSNSPVKQTDPNDPSQFTKDSNLHQSFYGIAYTPVGSQLPDCGNSLGEPFKAFFGGADANIIPPAAVIQDVQVCNPCYIFRFEGLMLNLSRIDHVPTYHGVYIFSLVSPRTLEFEHG